MAKLNDDLISRSKLLAAYDAAHKGPPGGARKLIVEAPTVDAVPVVHAHWKHYSQSDDCSNCGWSTGKYESPTPYCPGCGAKMDGGWEDVHGQR